MSQEQLANSIDDAEMESDVDLPTRLRALRDLNKFIPYNDFGLPIGIYRVDLLPFHEYDAQAYNANPLTTILAPHLNDAANGMIASAQQLGGSVALRDTAAEIPAEFSDFGVLGGGDMFDVDDVDDADADADLGDVDDVSPRDASGLVIVSEEGVDDGDDQRQLYRGTTDNALELFEEPSKPVHRTAGFITESLESAFMWLDYSEGFPTFTDGNLFWEALPHEPPQAFKIFQKYLQMSHNTLALVNEESDFRDTSPRDKSSGIRSVSILTSMLHARDDEYLAKQALYKEYAVMYYWDVRARAYDMFRVAQHRKQQELRAIAIQDDHYLKSERLMERVMDYFDDEEEFWDMMSPKIAIDFFKTLIQLQRVSVGLQASGPGTGAGNANSPTNYQSAEVIMRQIGQQVKRDDPAIAASMNVAQEGLLLDEEGQIQSATAMLNNALNDPAATQQLQEIIIRLTKGTKL